VIEQTEDDAVRDAGILAGRALRDRSLPHISRAEWLGQEEAGTLHEEKHAGRDQQSHR
jgi:hypothetical protein